MGASLVLHVTNTNTNSNPGTSHNSYPNPTNTKPYPPDSNPNPTDLETPNTRLALSCVFTGKFAVSLALNLICMSMQ